MSKRFGRNQRRRAREALAASEQRINDLECAIVMEGGLMASTRAKLSEARAFQRDVAEMVGREAVIAGEVTTLDYKWDADHGDHINYVPRQQLSMAMLCDRSEQEIYEMRHEVLRLLNVEAVNEVMRHMVHARVTLADERVGYGISEAALRRMSRDQLRKTIYEPMLDMLVDALKRRFK